MTAQKILAGIKGLFTGITYQYIYFLFWSPKLHRTSNNDDFIVISKGVKYFLPGSMQLSQYYDHIYDINPLTELGLLSFFSLNGGVFLDIGSFQGKYSLQIAKKNSKNRCYAIEANPYTFTILQNNISLNNLDTQIHAHNLLIGIDEDVVPFYLDASTSKVISNEEIDSYPSHRLKNIPSISFTNMLTNINVTLSEIDLIKIDVEGYEEILLKQIVGMQKKCKKGIRIICEIVPELNKSADMIISFMIDNGRIFKQLDKNNVLFKLI